MMLEMDLARRFAGQLADPHGRAGVWIGRAMDFANGSVTRRAVDLLDPQPGERILDAGCGTGAALAEVRRRERCRLVGIDRSEAMIAGAHHRLGAGAELRVGSIQQQAGKLPPVDGALLLNVLYFCAPNASMVRAVHDQLRPGGRLVAYVTHRATMERWSFVQEGYHRLFDEPGLAKVLADGGFAPSQISVHEEPVNRLARGLFAVAVR